MFSRIVVPVDGSALAEQAFPQVASLAVTFQAPIAFLRVVDISRLQVYGRHLQEMTAERIQHAIAEERHSALEYLDRITARFTGHGLKASGAVLQGFVNEMILGYVSGDDLLVLASRANSGLDHAHLGSTASALIQYASVPVLVVPPRAFATRSTQIFRSVHQPEM